MNRTNTFIIAILIALTSMPIVHASKEQSTISKLAIAERTFRGSVVGFLGGCISALLGASPYTSMVAGATVGAAIGTLAGYKAETRRIKRQERPSNTVIITDCAESATIGTAAGALLGLVLIPASLNRTHNFLPAKLSMCVGGLLGLLYTAKDIRNKYPLPTKEHAFGYRTDSGKKIDNNQTITIKREWIKSKNLKYFSVTAYNNTGKKIGSIDALLQSEKSVHVTGIAVDEEVRKQGVGRRLMCSLGHLIPGLEKVTLNANEDARIFYKKIGLFNYLKDPSCYKWTKRAREAEMAKCTFEQIDNNTVRVSKR